MRAWSRREWFIGVALAITYALLARASLQLALFDSNASPFWPPTGMAIAAALIWPRLAFPAIFIGATLANLWNGAPPGAALAIGVGNMGEALVASTLIRRWRSGTWEQDIGGLFAFLAAAVAGGLVSSTIGVIALVIAGAVSTASAAIVWATWLVGDVTGALLLTPLLVLAWRGSFRARPTVGERFGPFIALAAILLAGLVLVPADAVAVAILVLALPVMLWIAYRLTPIDAAGGTLLFVLIAVLATANQRGPIYSGNANIDLMVLALLGGTFSLTFLALAILIDKLRTPSPERTHEAVAAMIGEFENRRDLPELDRLHGIGQTIALAFAGIGLLLGVGVALVGWIGGLDVAKYILPSLVSMKFNTALGFVFGSTGVLLSLLRPQWLRRRWTAAGLTLMVGGLTLIQYMFAINLGIDELFVVDDTSVGTPFPGRPSPLTSVAFTLLGLALMFELTPWRRSRYARDVAVGGIAAIALLSFMSYVNGAVLFPVFTLIALHTSFGFLALSIAMMVHPQASSMAAILWEPDSAGSMMRRLLPAVFVVPVVAGAIRIATDVENIGPSDRVGITWLMFAMAAIMATFLAFAALRVRASENARRSALRTQSFTQHIQQLNAFRGRFINHAAHELRTPLVPIKVVSDMFTRRAQTEEDESLTKAVDMMQRSVDRLHELVEDLVGASRVDLQEMGLQRASMVVGELVEIAVAERKDSAEKSGLNLTCESIGDTTADVDEEQMKQVVGVLLSNAIKFTPEGGDVHVRTIGHAGSVNIEVNDTGIGVDEARIQELFHPMAQTHDEMAVTSSGIGLGLYLAKAIVDLHGGTITFQSEGIGKGSTVKISLPRQSSDKPTTSA